MTLIGHRSRNHPQQTAKRGPNPSVDDRGTPRPVFREISDRFGGFTIDVAASRENTKCRRFLTLDDDGLKMSWAGERVWCNPPYSDLRSWVEKAWAEAPACALIVMIVPANRTEQGWWQELVEPRRDQHRGGVRVEFLPGRIRFHAPGTNHTEPNERPPFGCALLIWSRSRR